MSMQKVEPYLTYDEWYALGDDILQELHNGFVYAMAPPSRRHQAISGEIFRQIANFLVAKPCKIFAAPFGVRLNKSIDTVYLPDITVVCDQSKLNDKGCEGAPDFIVEITSPSSNRLDKTTKYHAYQEAGVLEYWIVNPSDRTVDAYRMSSGLYIKESFVESDIAKVKSLPGCEIALSLVFGL